jgi:CRP/FNR family transcriptional regulator
MGKDDILKKFPFFSESPRSFQDEIREAAMPATLPAGSFYVQEGDICSSLALVGSGTIRVLKIGETGREITLYNVYGGEVCLLNVACLLSGLPSPATARVEETVQALAIPQPMFLKWMSSHDAMREYIFGVVASRFAAVTSLIEEVAFKKMDQRLSAYLCQRFNGGPVREISVTHEQIAADLGTAREVVSRLLKDLERRDIIGLSRGRIQLKNDTMLRSTTGEV